MSFLLDAEMVAHTMIVFKHLLIGTHIEVAFEPVQIAILNFGIRLDEASDFN